MLKFCLCQSSMKNLNTRDASIVLPLIENMHKDISQHDTYPRFEGFHIVPECLIKCTFRPFLHEWAHIWIAFVLRIRFSLNLVDKFSFTSSKKQRGLYSFGLPFRLHILYQVTVHKLRPYTVRLHCTLYS